MQKYIYFIILIIMFPNAISGQQIWHKKGHDGCPVCYASDRVERVFIPPPGDFDFPLKSAAKRSEFIVTYRLFPAEAKAAFEYAVGIWESLIASPVPIRVLANWFPKGENVLGSARPGTLEKNFKGAPHMDIYYPIALAEKLTGTEINSSNQPDIIIEFNRDINWYFGTDGNTPEQLYDFVSVVLHEIAHGLGFFGFFFVEKDQGSYGYWSRGDATIYDRMVERLNGDQLINLSIYNNPSVELKSALVSGFLYSNSIVARSDWRGVNPRLYAPSVWSDGSSVYHLNNSTYPSSNVNSLMTSSLARGQAIHDPGPVTMGILADMGWKTVQFEFNPPKDSEEVVPVSLEIVVHSDFTLDSTRLFVIFSDDSMVFRRDSVRLYSSQSGIFETAWTPEQESRNVQYYFSATDIKNRTFRYPSEAPGELFVLNFGPDTVKPVIVHEPIPYYFDSNLPLQFIAHINDNLGVDSVFVEFTINDMEKFSFGLVNDSADIYSAPFPVESNLLKDGDVIAYQIVALDASIAKNRGALPEEGKYRFQVEKMYEPVMEYATDFDSPGSDFILVDFSVYTESKFENGALHSPHPYPSPEEDNKEYNFVTILKYPVILTDAATMRFDEVVLVEPGNDGTVFGDFEFWDYVIVEGSKDRGVTWLPLINGYDSRANAIWEKTFNDEMDGINSRAVGSSDLIVTRQINMLENGNFFAGDTLLIRFRLYSDPYANGWGWVIDNLIIQQIVTASPAPLLSSGNFHIYPNPFKQAFSVEVDAGTKIERLELELFNILGQRVWGETIKNVSGLTSIDVEIDRSPGIYLFVARENGVRVFSRKLISR